MFFNIPRKVGENVKIYVSLILIVASVICCFLPIFKIHTSGTGSKEIIDKANELFGDKVEELPEDINVTAIDVWSSISLLTNALKAAKSQDTERLQKLIVDDQGNLTDKSKRAIGLVSASMVTLENGAKDSEGKDLTGIGKIIVVIINFVALLYLLGFTALMPIVFIITLIVALIRLASKTMERAEKATKTSAAITNKLQFPLLFILIQCVLPGMSLAIGSIGLLIASVIGVVIAILATRFRRYSPADVKYVNLVQGISLISVVGFIFFFISIMKAGVTVSFFGGGWSEYTVAAELARKAGATDVGSMHIVDGVLIFIAIVLTMSIIKYFTGILQRLSFTDNLALKKNGFADAHIGSGVVFLFIVLIPEFVMMSKHRKPGFGSDEASSFLSNLSDGQKSALIMALIGLVIMLAAEILLAVLRKKLCPAMTANEVNAVISGTAMTAEERKEAAQKELEKAQAALNFAAAQANATQVPEEKPEEPKE